MAEADVIGVIVGSEEGKVHYVNDYFLKMLGYSRADFEAGQINWREITPPQDLLKDAEVIKELNLGNSHSYEKEYIHQNGQPVPVLIGATKLDGYEVNTGIGFVLDLSERKRIARELKNLNQELEQKVEDRTADLKEVNQRLLVEVAERKRAEQSLTDYLIKLSCFQETLFRISCADSLADIYNIAIASVNAFLGTSRAALLLTNQDHTQVYFAADRGISTKYRQNIGQTLSESGYISNDRVAMYADVNQSAALKPILSWLNEEGIGSIASFPLKYQEKLMGRLVTYYDQPYGFTDEDINLASALATSVAVAISRQRTEMALRDREQQYHSLVDNIPGVIYRMLPDRNFTIQFVSDEIEKIVGYPSSDLINNRVRSFADITHPEDFPWIANDIKQVVGLGQPFELKYRLIAADGGIKWVYEKGQGVLGSDGEIAYIDGVIFDISDRQALEFERQLYEEQLHNLYQTVFELGRAQDLEQLYAVALAGVKLTLKCDRLAILLLNSTKEWQIVEADGLSHKHSQLIEDCLNAKSAQACANNHELGVKIYADIKKSPLPKPLLEISLAEGITSIGVAWIKYQDTLVGQVAFHYDQLHEFSDQEIELVDTLATYIGIAITRKQAEQALSASEAKYRSLVDNLRGAIYRCNLSQEWKAEFMSDAIQDVCGYPPTYFTGAGGKSFLSLVHKGDRQRVSLEAQLALEEHRPYELEYRIIDAEDRVRWVLDRGIGIYDDAGNCLYEDGVIFDISDRKATEEELRQSKETQQAIIDAIPDLLVRMHRNGTYLGIMSGGEVTLLDPDQMKPGQNVRDLTPSNFAKERLRYVEQALDRQELQVYEYQVDSQGESRDEEARIVPCGNDEALIMVRDITDRKQAERALKDSEEKYRILFNSIGDPVFVHGHNRQVPTEFMEVNDLACDSLGYSRAELSKMTVKDILPPGFKYDPEAIATFLRDREAIFKVEHIHKNGDRFPVEVRAKSFDLAGELIVVGIARDVSEHKRIEAELRRAYEQQKELADLRSKFIAMVSHEFRTPMSSILLSIDLLQHKSADWSDQKKQHRFARIRQGIKRIDNLIEDVLVIGKMNSGTMKFQPMPVDLITLCIGAIEEARISTTKHQILFKIEGLTASDILDSSPEAFEPNHHDLVSEAIALEKDHAQIVTCLRNTYMDEKLLQHILTNLLFNAVKYSPQGGEIELSLVFQSGQVPIEILQVDENDENSDRQVDYLTESINWGINGNSHGASPTTLDRDLIGYVCPKPFQPLKAIGMVTISVRDLGIGIEPEELSLIFKAFYRGQNVSNAPGNGLGLAIVKNAVDLHRGQISVASQVGQGTTFTVKLPVYAIPDHR